MARLWESGFETGTTEWNGGNSGVGSVIAVQSTVKRSGTYALNMAVAGVVGYIRHIFDANQTELFGRFALRIDSVASGRTSTLLSFVDSYNNIQFAIRYNSGTGSLEWYKWYDDAWVLIGIGYVVLNTDTWYVIEFHVVVGSIGSLTLKVNGTTASTYSGDTDFASGHIRSIYFRLDTGSGTANVYLDDIAINNAAGDYQNSWVGLGGVYWLYPTADGYQNDWTPSTGLDNYAMVDERPPNTTDYVQALDAADLDLYELLDTPEYVSRINLLRVMYRAAVTTAGSNDLRDVIRVDSVNHEGDMFTVVPLIPSFTLYTGPAYYLNPETAAAWEVAEVDALEAGFEIV